MGGPEPTFGEWLRQRRRQLDLVQTELAHRVGYSVVTIRKLERDLSRPSRQLALRLAEQLQIPVREHASFVQFARLGQDIPPPELPVRAKAGLASAALSWPEPASLASLSPHLYTPLIG